MSLERSLPPEEVNYQAGGKFYKDRRYELRMGGLLSDPNLEEGDTLPEDATYRIIAVKLIRERKTGLARFAIVTAEKQVTSRTHLSQFDRVEEHHGLDYKYHTYQIALGTSLGANGLAESGELPEDATYYIGHSQITVGGKSALANIAQVVAFKNVASRTELPFFRRQEDRDGMTLAHRLYQLPFTSWNAALSTFDIEEGDDLPGDAAYEIIHAERVPAPGTSFMCLVAVTGRKFGAWAD